MCSLSYFFSLWPAPLQWELCRLLSAHILARREVALTRGKPPDRLYFVVQGRVRPETLSCIPASNPHY